MTSATASVFFGKNVFTRYWAHTSIWYSARNNSTPDGTMVQITSRLWLPCENSTLSFGLMFAPRHSTYPSTACVAMNVTATIALIM